MARTLLLPQFRVLRDPGNIVYTFGLTAGGKRSVAATHPALPFIYGGNRG